MEDSMINMPDLVFDEKIGNKRVRDGEEDEIHIGRLEKRPSGIVGVNNGGDYTGDGGDEDGDSGGGGGGIIDAFISNVFHKNRNGTAGEVEDDGKVKTGNEDKKEHLGNDGGGGHGGDGGGVGGGGDGGGGIIGSFFSNIFQHNGSVDEDGEQTKSDHVGGDSGGDGGGSGGDGGGGGPEEDVNAQKLSDKKDEEVDLPSKDPKGDALKLKPDDYAERVFFLNNN